MKNRRKFCLTSWIFLVLVHYPHRSRDSFSPVCGILISCVNFKSELFRFIRIGILCKRCCWSSIWVVFPHAKAQDMLFLCKDEKLALMPLTQWDLRTNKSWFSALENKELFRYFWVANSWYTMEFTMMWPDCTSISSFRDDSWIFLWQRNVQNLLEKVFLAVQ